MTQNIPALNQPLQTSYKPSNWDPKTLGDPYIQWISALHPTLPFYRSNSFYRKREKPGKVWRENARVTKEALLIPKGEKCMGRRQNTKEKNKVCAAHSRVTPPPPCNNLLIHFQEHLSSTLQLSELIWGNKKGYHQTTALLATQTKIHGDNYSASHQGVAAYYSA